MCSWCTARINDGMLVYDVHGSVPNGSNGWFLTSNAGFADLSCSLSHFSLPFLTPPPPTPALPLASSFPRAPTEHVKVQGHVRVDEAGAGGENVSHDE